MAMKDIKSIEVAPADENKTVQLWMSFGWELKNNQRVKTQDVQKFTGQDSDGTEHYQTVRGVDFIKLTFERDPARKNYAELKALEEQYYTPLPSSNFIYRGDKPKKPGVFALIMMVISFLIAVILLMCGFGAIITGSVGGGVTCFIFSVILSLLGIRVIMKRKSFSSRLKSWEETNEKYQTQKAAEEKAFSEAKKKLDLLYRELCLGYAECRLSKALR